MATLSIIVPTSGRATLKRTLASIADQLEPGDELLVACNSYTNYGDRAIDEMQEKVSGDVVLYCDDDDIYLPGALARIRAWADANPGKIGLFRRSFPNGAKQWRWPSIHPSNVQRMCFVIPNVRGGLPTWTGYRREADVIREAAERQHAETVFVDDVIGLARPLRHPSWRKLRFQLRLRTRLRILRGADEGDALRA